MIAASAYSWTTRIRTTPGQRALVPAAVDPWTADRAVGLRGDRTTQTAAHAGWQLNLRPLIVTSDNPRTEDPGRIIAQILSGFVRA